MAAIPSPPVFVFPSTNHQRPTLLEPLQPQPQSQLRPPQPPSSPSSRFSLADFPMPPPLQSRHSEPTPGYWQKLLSKSSYAIRRKTFNGEGRTSNGGIERGDVWLSDDEDTEEEEGLRTPEEEEEEEEDGFCIVRPRAVSMNPSSLSSSPSPSPSHFLPSLQFEDKPNPISSSFRFPSRPQSDINPQPTDLQVVIPTRFSSLSTTSTRGHAKSRRNMHKAHHAPNKKSTGSTASSGSSGAASTIRATSTRTLRRVPSTTSTIRSTASGATVRSLGRPGQGERSPLDVFTIPPPPPIPIEHLGVGEGDKPIVPPRRSSLPKKASRRELRSKKSAETSSRGH